ELDRVLNEEHGDVVAHEVPVALFGVELDGKAPYVARRVDRTSSARHRREAREYGRLATHLGEDARARVAGERMGEREGAVGADAACVHDALGDALVVEVGDLLS